LVDGSGIYDKEEIVNFANNCNTVVLMYDFHNTNSFNKIKFDILPLLTNNISPNIYSIIIVGNKLDLLDTNTQKFVIDQDKSSIETFQESSMIVMKYFYISCKNYLNISPLFSEILNTLINPIHIFYSQNNNDDMIMEKPNIHTKFNDNFIKALTRIFRILDKDRINLISNNDFKKIHEEIYKTKLENDHFTALSEFIKSVSKDNLQTLEKGINLENFIELNKASVEINESQITWSMLRRFGYNDNLNIDEGYYKSKNLYQINTCDYIVELSNQSKQALTDLFNQFSIKTQGNKPIVTEKEWKTIFYPVRIMKEHYSFNKIFKKFNPNNNDDSISLEDWIMVWQCMCRLNYEETYKIFLYLGFDMDLENFIKKVKKAENLFYQLPQKTIHVCFIAQNQFNINNFLKFFSNSYYLGEGKGDGGKDLIIKTDSGYSIIVSNLYLSG
jgi:Ras family protein T1